MSDTYGSVADWNAGFAAVQQTDWRYPSLNMRATGPTPLVPQGEPVLMAWGPIHFTVVSFNTHQWEHESETDWAKKPIAGAAIYREWVGENDEIIVVRGRLFPYRLGGLPTLEWMEGLRRVGSAQSIMRGDGVYLGWYVCEKLHRTQSYLSSQGIGQEIEFEATFARCPVPSAQDIYSSVIATVPT